MSYLADSNLLLRSVQPSSPLYSIANQAAATLLAQGENIYLRPQVSIEFSDVSGKQVHDARLVAAMPVHGISYILTLNGSDFTRFQNARPAIAIVGPGSI